MLNTAFNIYLTISTHPQIIGKKSSNCLKQKPNQPMQSIQPIQTHPNRFVSFQWWNPRGSVLIFLDVATATLWAQRYRVLRVLRFFGHSRLGGGAAVARSWLRGTTPHGHRLYRRWQGKQKRSGVIFFFFGGGGEGRCLFLFLIFFLGGGGDFKRGVMLESDFAIWLGRMGIKQFFENNQWRIRYWYIHPSKS